MVTTAGLTEKRGLTQEAELIERLEASEAALRAAHQRTQRQLTAVAALGEAASFCSGDFETFARELTEQAARTSGCARANVWLFNDDQTELRCIDAYQAGSDCHSSGATLAEKQFAAEFSMIKHALYVDAGDALTDPRTAGYRDGYLVPQGILSMLDVAIRTGPDCVGLLCLEHVGIRHAWAPDEIAFGCHLADKLGQAFMNQALRQSQNQLSLACQVAQIGIYDWDIIQDKLLLNARLSALFETSNQYFGGGFEGWLACVHPDDRSHCARIVADAMQASSSFTLAYRVMLPGGDIRHLESHALIQRDAEQNPIRILGVNWDCTERRRSEEIISRQARQYATMIATTSDGFWLLDSDGKFQDMNEFLLPNDRIQQGRAVEPLDRRPGSCRVQQTRQRRIWRPSRLRASTASRPGIDKRADPLST